MQICNININAKKIVRFEIESSFKYNVEKQDLIHIITTTLYFDFYTPSGEQYKIIYEGRCGMSYNFYVPEEEDNYRYIGIPINERAFDVYQGFLYACSGSIDRHRDLINYYMNGTEMKDVYKYNFYQHHIIEM